METIRMIPLSNLISRRRPICATASISLHRQTTTAPISDDVQTLNSNPNSKILKSLPEPSIIKGTLSLPSSNQTPPRHSFFSFSDDSVSVYCDVVHFDFSMIGKKIEVLSWNYIPLKCGGGLLEIIKWRFLDDYAIVDDNLFPFVFNDVGNCCDSKAKYSVNGIVKSVSPVLIVSCSMDMIASEALCVRGFIVELVNNDSLEDFVYFSGSLSRWHPAFSRLIRKVISLSRLKKKLVYIGKEEGRLMYVANEVTRLCFLSLKEKDLSCQKKEGVLGVYLGVVRGVYMQGMVIELDEEVWLLMTEESLVFTCSVRVGTILHVRNVHIVDPKFRWGKMLVLGACSKTTITTISFSPWENGNHIVSQSHSLLRKFIDSLAFPARLWILLVVQCFRKKFSGLFSEKEILGTKHVEGLVQTYARSVLPSSVYQLRSGLFMDFCKHDSCRTGNNVSYNNLSLAVPLSNLLGNCDRIWCNSFLELKKGFEILEDCSQADHPFRGNKLSNQPIRRIFPSKDLGISLVGNLKLSQDTGRFQLTDATGCIDAVIPDYPPDWNMDVIFEVVDYTLVLEGKPGLWDQMWVLDDDLFSSSNIFCSRIPERQTKLTVYVHFQWSNIRFRHFPIPHCPSSKDSFAKLDSGIFHLLCLVHKFPLQPQFHGDFLISGSCRLFAEVMVLPWDLNVVPSDNAAPSDRVLKDESKNCSYNGYAFKRCKTHHTSSCADKIEFCNNFKDFQSSSCTNSSNFLPLPHETGNIHNICGASHVQIPCTTFVRGINCQGFRNSVSLCYIQGVGNSSSFLPTSLKKLLLEFNSRSMLKYELMHIGVYYIIKHLPGKCFCDSRDINLGNKVTINMETRLWSTSFHFNEVGSKSGSCIDPTSNSFSVYTSSRKSCLQNELVIYPGCDSHGSLCDVSLHIATNATSHMNAGIQALKEAVTALSVSSTNMSILGQQVSCTHSVVGFGSSLPEGNLMSLRGTVTRLQVSGDGFLEDIHLRKTLKGSICLLVLTDGQMIQIVGCLSKHNYPVGLAPGADVTFHRILALSGQNRFTLTPVSFMSVHVMKDASTDLYSCFSVNEEPIPSCLISDLTQSDICKPKRLCCRVVGVYFVRLERDKKLDKLLSCIRSWTPIINIPLAGFILDDGSSRCFCWANGERAATFLRLHDKPLEVCCGSSWWRSKDSVTGKSGITHSFQLNKILKKHGRVTVKNCGSIHDTLSQDLHLLNGSNCFFGTQDQSLFKLIVFNACSSILWSVTAHVMDSNSASVLEKFLLEEQMPLHALQNVWARDVSQVDTLTESREVLQELKSGTHFGQSDY